MNGTPKSRSKSQPPKSRVPASPQPRRTLTAKNLRTLPVGDFTDSAVRGLTLRVRPSGARAWALRYRVRQGRAWSAQRRLHFGEVGGPLALDLVALGLAGDFLPPRAVLGLTEARQVAQALLGLAARGSDPLALLSAATEARERKAADEARRQAQGLASLGELLDRYIAFRADPPKGAKMPKGQKQGPIRPATLAGWQSLARGALAPLRGHDPATLTVEDVENWHQATGTARGTVAANRGLELLATMFTWAMATRGEDGQRLLSASPCGPVRAYEEQPRSRVLDSEELVKTWGALEGEPLGDAIRMLIWTGARKNEATGAEWREVDFAAKLWTVPAERSKTGEARKVPLSVPALAMLRHRREGDPTGRWVFPSTVAAVGPVGSLQALLRRVQTRSGVTDWTLHDLRRVVRSGLSALGVAPSVAEFILGHLPPRLVRTYDRHEPDRRGRRGAGSMGRPAGELRRAGGRRRRRGRVQPGAGAVSDARSLTRDDLDRLAVAHPGPSLGEVLDLLALSDDELRRRAARALRDPDGETPELRRLLAWKLERVEKAKPARRGRPRAYDTTLAKAFYRLREEGATYEAATEALSRTGDPFDRTPGRKAKATFEEGRRLLREFVELVSEAASAARAK